MKNILLVIGSFLVSLVIIEFFLIINGTYYNLSNTKLEHSDSIYERPKNSIQKQKHPDVNYIIKNYYDLDGVKNNNNITTSQKENIIGIFGDSFTENIGVDSQFEFTNILQKKIKNFQIVNYGVGGYEIDSIFLRFNKFKNHDIKYIFYLYFPGDENLSQIISFDEKDNLIINKIKINIIYHFLGKLNLTYLFIDAFYNLRSFFYNNYSNVDVNNYNQILANKVAKQNKKIPKSDIEGFYKILKKFQKISIENNIDFTVLVFPTKGSIEFFRQFIDKKDYKINYIILNDELNSNLKFRFKNDPHWNEYGNLEFAKNLYQVFQEKKIIQKENKNFLSNKNQIDLFYEANKNN